MDDVLSKERIIDSTSCPSCSLQRRPSMMKRLRQSFRRAINKEVLASESKMVSGALRPSLSAEMLHSPKAFSEEPCDRRSSDQVIFRATTLWDNLVSYLETNVNPGTRRRSLRMYNNCFYGHEAVSCLHKYITTNLSRQCDREDVAILCHRFLVLGIIEDAKYAPEVEDFNTGLLYRLTEQKKFWELAFSKPEDQETDESCKEETLTLTCLSNDCRKAAEEEISDKCNKMQERKSLRRSVLEGAKFHLKESRPANLDCELSSTKEISKLNSRVIRTVDSNKTNQYLSNDTKSSSTNDVDSSTSGSSKETEWESEAQTLTILHHKTKKLAQTRKRRWHSLREKSHKAGNKQAQLIPQLKTKMSLKKKKHAPVSVSETKKHWIAFGYI